MGNKKKTTRERYNIDPRTKKRRRKQTSIAVTRSSESSLTPQPTTNNIEENTTISLSCAPSSSSSLETSTLPARASLDSTVTARASLDSTVAAISVSEKNIKQSEWQPPSTSPDTDGGGVESIADDDIVDDGHQSAYVFMDHKYTFIPS